jgi:hypothetical protein
MLLIKIIIDQLQFQTSGIVGIIAREPTSETAGWSVNVQIYSAWMSAENFQEFKNKINNSTSIAQVTFLIPSYSGKGLLSDFS